MGWEGLRQWGEDATRIKRLAGNKLLAHDFRHQQLYFVTFHQVAQPRAERQVAKVLRVVDPHARIDEELSIGFLLPR